MCDTGETSSNHHVFIRKFWEIRNLKKCAGPSFNCVRHSVSPSCYFICASVPSINVTGPPGQVVNEVHWMKPHKHLPQMIFEVKEGNTRQWIHCVTVWETGERKWIWSYSDSIYNISSTFIQTVLNELLLSIDILTICIHKKIGCL